MKPNDAEWWYIHSESIARLLEDAKKARGTGNYREVANIADTIEWSAKGLAAWARLFCTSLDASDEEQESFEAFKVGL